MPAAAAMAGDDECEDPWLAAVLSIRALHGSAHRLIRPLRWVPALMPADAAMAGDDECEDPWLLQCSPFLGLFTAVLTV